MGKKHQITNMTFEQCKFKREQYADTLIKLIDFNDSLSENNSFVIALDSPWGTGKSTFINMMKNKIDEECENCHVVVYNAWNNDYCENPFEPLFYDIINNEIFETEVDINHIKNLVVCIK